MNLTPTQLIQKAILKSIRGYYHDFECPNNLETPEDVEAAWDFAEEGDYIQDAENEFRSGEFNTPEIRTPFSRNSRNYEERAVAAQIDGFHVGWVYWFGGGKFGEPEAIPWMDDAYFLDCKEEEKMVVVRTFIKK